MLLENRFKLAYSQYIGRYLMLQPWTKAIVSYGGLLLGEHRFKLAYFRSGLLLVYMMLAAIAALDYDNSIFFLISFFFSFFVEWRYDIKIKYELIFFIF